MCANPLISGVRICRYCRERIWGSYLDGNNGVFCCVSHWLAWLDERDARRKAQREEGRDNAHL